MFRKLPGCDNLLVAMHLMFAEVSRSGAWLSCRKKSVEWHSFCVCPYLGIVELSDQSVNLLEVFKDEALFVLIYTIAVSHFAHCLN